MNKYDLIVIGAGPGGITVARFTKSLRKEWDVLIIRKQKKVLFPVLYLMLLMELLR